MASSKTGNNSEKPRKIHASPTKEFFISMITRDITLLDCMFDLLDNCLDGAGRDMLSKAKSTESYDGYYAKVTFDAQSFRIEDNCGGHPSFRSN